ncbi:hypothetical protein LIER_25410 [Lithospermum erythrorhizon]|uniref:Uncharacterized protein n=1 Tax=Lithospermum erythrorhizon TaxID=34254 RepID=A0AAV3R4Q8_LITER
MSKLIKGQRETRTSWAGTIIAHMLEFVCNPQSSACIPYAALITKLLASLGVKILDDECETLESGFVSANTLEKWNFSRGPQGWVKKRKSDAADASTSGTQISIGGHSEVPYPAAGAAKTN